MKKIRQGVFETNSSSTHTICIAKKINPELPERIHFNFGEYGWENGVLKTKQQKANYLYTGLIFLDRKNDAENIFKTLNSKGIKVTAQQPLDTKLRTDNPLLAFEYISDDKNGYIDHGDNLVEFLDAVCTKEDELMSYLFSELSHVITGNDNDGEMRELIIDYPNVKYYKGN